MTTKPELKMHEIAPDIGYITIGWNEIHFFVFIKYWRLMKNDAMRAQSTFFATRSDRAQRNVTKALVELVLEPWPDLQKKAVKLLNKIDKLAARRNDVIHAMWGAAHPEATAAIFGASSPRLSGKDIKKEFKSLLKAINNTAAETGIISKEINETVSGKKLPKNALLGLLSQHPLPQSVLPPSSEGPALLNYLAVPQKLPQSSEE